MDDLLCERVDDWDEVLKEAKDGGLDSRSRSSAYHGMRVEVVMRGESSEEQGLLNAGLLREAVVEPDSPSIGMKLLGRYACLARASRCVPWRLRLTRLTYIRS